MPAIAAATIPHHLPTPVTTTTPTTPTTVQTRSTASATPVTTTTTATATTTTATTTSTTAIATTTRCLSLTGGKRQFKFRSELKLIRNIGLAVRHKLSRLCNLVTMAIQISSCYDVSNSLRQHPTHLNCPHLKRVCRYKVTLGH